MMFVAALLFSISSCLDNLVIGTAYGIKKIKIGWTANLIIALITTSGTLLSMSLGLYISKCLPLFLANEIGAGAIVLLGVYFILESSIKRVRLKPSKSLAVKDLSDMVDYAEKSDRDQSGDINIKEAIFVAGGLTFNNIGAGIAASVTGVNITVTVFATFTVSLLTITLGESIGSHVIGRGIGQFAPIIAGGLLLFLGIIEMVH